MMLFITKRRIKKELLAIMKSAKNVYEEARLDDTRTDRDKRDVFMMASGYICCALLVLQIMRGEVNGKSDSEEQRRIKAWLKGETQYNAGA